MRVIAGEFRSRALKSVEGFEVRPTPDRLRQRLFDVIAGEVEGTVFLDAYAGTGAVGIEALSRGAAAVTFVEQGAPAIQILQKNLENLGIRGASAKIEKRSVGRFLRGSIEKAASGAFSVVFLDPPYDLAEEYAMALGLLGGEGVSFLAPGAWVIAEHRRKQALAESYGNLSRVRLLEQGDAALSFYEVGSS